MNYIIDRFEGKFAVCEKYDGLELEYVNIEKEVLPNNLKEGDVITFDGNKYFFNDSETKARKNLLNNKFNSLWK